MPHPQAIPSFSGIAGIDSAQFLLSRGTRPSSGTITTPLVEQIAPPVGDFTITYNGTTLTLANCAVVESNVNTGGGPTLTIRFEDRRWAWAFTEIVGQYNVREGSDTIRHEKTPQQLATLIFQAMGETLYDVSALPNDARPFVDWTNTPCDMALGALLADLGCDVVPNLAAGGWVIVNIGSGALLPGAETVEHASYTVTSPKTPDRIQVATAPARYQCLFVLEAVGEEIDGTIKPIDALSYTPADGWEGEEPTIFSGVTDTYTEDGVTLHARSLALATVFRWYRIVAPADGGGANELNPPGFEAAQAGDPAPPDLEELDDLLPLLPQLNTTYETLDGTERPKRPKLFGRWDDGNYDADDETNVDNGTRWPYGFSLDLDQGIVKLPFWAALKAEGGDIAPAKFFLLATCEATWRGLNKKVYYAEGLNKVGVLTPVLVKSIVRNDIIPKYIANYDITDPDAPEVTSVDDNADDVTEQAGFYLSAMANELVDAEGGTASYADLLLVQPDGAIEQVEWIVDGGGTTTRAARFTRLAPYLPDYKEMQRQAQAARDREAAAQAKFVIIKTGIGGIMVPL